MKIGNLTVTPTGDREIEVTRAFDAPRALVFDALTRPELIRRWLSSPPAGPWSFASSTFASAALPLQWKGPGGASMGMRGVIREIAAPGLVATERFDEAGTGEIRTPWSSPKRAARPRSR
jgi:uncharacterized protein YndB with AHSA1/START domain